MSDGFSLTIALLVTVVLGALATAFLWLMRRRQAETAAGIAALAEMRWREFARLVVEALRGRGFEAEGIDQALDRGPQAELRLRRDGQTWLLACRVASARSQLGTGPVRELADAVRVNAAQGGILATPARINAPTRSAASRLELYDGEALWALVAPMLPNALRDDITLHARKRSVRETALAWTVAVALGVIAGLVPAFVGGPAEPSTEPAASESAPPPAEAPAPPAKPAAPGPALDSAAPADPNRDQFERGEVIHAVSVLPWVERALWSTSSTLVIQQREDVDQLQIEEICAVLARYDALRASRLQLQPPAGSQRKVRFLQCRAY
ncbi:restriction endonuclease [Lysobacter sp. LF1]|uniref:Restriction endonuclease n=1 Tax=Lysobacter stagni TaxID=3045172 RepID=A0ABT6XJ07_9GAMM|nr:restriction endonuclease [Lysobacter sp. LF1]MDI9240148.1 restriction endonuclease [Lysobacter sp. LF1]